jgi:hypothetical protein
MTVFFEKNLSYNNILIEIIYYFLNNYINFTNDFTLFIYADNIILLYYYYIIN